MSDTDEADERKYRAPALEKGLDVLELLAANGVAMTPSQMSSVLGRSVSELFRMIQVLEYRGYIEQSPAGYALTNRLFTLGLAQAPVKSLTEAALPFMRDLAAQTRQSCHLVVLSEDQIVVIARIEGPGDLGFSVRLGYRREAIDATSGLLLYGMGSPSLQTEFRERLAKRFDEARIEAFIQAAAKAAKEGHVERASDFVQGVTDLVAPILGTDGAIATLISPYIQQTPPTCDMPTAAALLRRTAAAISAELGPVTQAL
ncbi:transcriptional regulator [Brevundimonas sp. Leaf363]|uniref:IclR family transcriptional regulator n=1 Tax=Brevundimonas sp. Leaf363 TaxID=1736353 RepID=UPI0006F65FEC|nr:helix-turn-helix domain-containing protein [Brevundimonas sp. Leaf363]KQS54255.1 transcriptional regulator [Brevundimonas sp. Leaf363]